MLGVLLFQKGSELKAGYSKLGADQVWLKKAILSSQKLTMLEYIQFMTR